MRPRGAERAATGLKLWSSEEEREREVLGREEGRSSWRIGH